MKLSEFEFDIRCECFSRICGCVLYSRRRPPLIEMGAKAIQNMSTRHFFSYDLNNKVVATADLVVLEPWLVVKSNKFKSN
jgi:hypothetical protein